MEQEVYIVENVKKEKKEIPNGTYEGIITKISPTQTDSGKKKIDIGIQVRADVASNPAEWRNWYVWDTIWYDETSNSYDTRKISNIVSACIYVEGSLKLVGIQSVLDILQGACVKIKVRHGVGKNLKPRTYIDYEQTDYQVEKGAQPYSIEDLENSIDAVEEEKPVSDKEFDDLLNNIDL